MKILIVSTVQTHPITSGSARFINSYSKMLRNMGHDVYFLHIPPVYKAKKDFNEGIQRSYEFWEDHYFLYRLSIINKIAEKIGAFYYRYFRDSYSNCDNRYIWGLANYVNELNSKYKFDACLINYYWLSKLLTKIDIKRKAIITHDSFTYNNIRNNVRSLLNLTPNEEAKALQRCPYIFAMQNDEKIFFERLAPRSKVLLSYCMYDFHDQALVYNHNLVFLSSGFYLNINGLNWFLDQIFPEILKVFPDCRLKIAGSICKLLSAQDLCPNVDLLGFVEDAADLYALGDVAINPTYQGTGLKIKTFESVSYNKVTMAHPHSAVGMFDKEHAPLFISDSAEEWVGYLSAVWKYDDMIKSIRYKNEEYIKSLNEFVVSQFEEFLKD